MAVGGAPVRHPAGGQDDRLGLEARSLFIEHVLGEDGAHCPHDEDETKPHAARRVATGSVVPSHGSSPTAGTRFELTTRSGCFAMRRFLTHQIPQRCDPAAGRRLVAGDVLCQSDGGTLGRTRNSGAEGKQPRPIPTQFHRTRDMHVTGQSVGKISGSVV